MCPPGVRAIRGLYNNLIRLVSIMSPGAWRCADARGVCAQVRVWNIPEQRVVDWADVHEMVTATAFAPDGRRAVVGTMKGRCRFYQCEPSFKLEYQAQIGACPQLYDT